MLMLDWERRERRDNRDVSGSPISQKVHEDDDVFTSREISQYPCYAESTWEPMSVKKSTH